MRRSKWVASAWLLSLILTAFTGDGGDPDRSIERIPLGVQPPAMVSTLTGPKSPARTDELWNIAGADVGFTFEHDDKTYMVFGDTWGRDGVEGDDWRSNTMAIVEPDPLHGYIVTDAITDESGEAKELLPSLKQGEKEYTVIPTGGVSVGDRMYLHYMSVRDWDKKWWGYKKPIPNGSGIAYSDDDGQTWIKDETARWNGNTPFTQVVMVKFGDYVYMFGTPAGRFGAAKLLRVQNDHLLDPDEYEYWNGDGWSSDVNRAVEVVPFPAGELSVRWSSYHQQWLMMYMNEVTHTIDLRTADQLTGPWDAPRVVVTDAEYPTLYAPCMLPIDGSEVYFTMSVFRPDYQVFLMRLTL